MNKKTLTKLEYHKIIDILIEQATSFGGKERCKRLKPMTRTDYRRIYPYH